MCALQRSPPTRSLGPDDIDIDIDIEAHRPPPPPPPPHLSRSLPHPPSAIPAHFTPNFYTTTDSLLSRNREFQHLLASQLETHLPVSLSLSGNGNGNGIGNGNGESPIRARKPSNGAGLNNPQLRVLRLIGAGEETRYDWGKYLKSEEELRGIRKKDVREYYAKNNELIQIYLYVDRLLDSSLPGDLLRTYHDQEQEQEQEQAHADQPTTSTAMANSSTAALQTDFPPPQKVKKRPSYLYKIADESSPLLGGGDADEHVAERPAQTQGERERVVRVAIYVNMLANVALLAAKVVITLLTSSLSVTASLVDGVMDLLSSTIIFIAAKLIERRNQHEYPVGRSRLEPISILVFSTIMITSFLQVGIACLQRLFPMLSASPSPPQHEIVQLTPTAISVMAMTVLIKGACWFAYRLVRNSSVQALAADAKTDVVFNFFSTLFPLVGFYAGWWWADPVGGLLLSIYVVWSWGMISKDHIQHLTGSAAPPQLRNAVLYLTMRFARAIRQVVALQAYYAGDRLNVEIDLVVEEELGLRDSHDLGESLQYVVESLPVVERAFVHLDYTAMNPYGHLH